MGFLYCTWFQGLLAQALAGSGQLSEAVTAVEDVLAFVEQRQERWALPALLRIKGESTLAVARQAGAIDCLRKSLDCAARQGALFWELRSATSLAHLLRERDQAAKARDQLQSVF